MDKIALRFFGYKKIIIVACSFLLAGLLFVVSTESAFAASKNLSISRIQQTEDHWCWAASCAMAGKFISSARPNQSSIVSYIFGGLIDTGAYDAQIVSALNYATNKSSHSSSPYSYSSIKSTINGNRPLLAKFTWTSGSGNHLVVVSGYNTSGSKVQLIDPWYGCGKSNYAYANIINGTSVQSGTGYYSKTFYHN